MKTAIRITLSASAFVACSCGFAFAQTPTSPAPPQAPRPSVLVRTHARPTTPVPPEYEIEILDPNADALGNPAVEVGPDVAVDGNVRVHIPRTVLVHRYYYTGDRDFQGPLLPGGPSLVVVNHPVSGERLYIEMNLLPGAPHVTYRERSIEYDYGPQAITLAFGLCGKPKITIRDGVPLSTRAKNASENAKQNARRLAQRSGLTEARRKVHAGAKNVAANAVDRVHDISKAAVTPVIQVLKIVPGVKLLAGTPDQRAEDLRDTSVKQAAAEAQKLDATIPTVR